MYILIYKVVILNNTFSNTFKLLLFISELIKTRCQNQFENLYEYLILYIYKKNMKKGRSRSSIQDSWKHRRWNSLQKYSSQPLILATKPPIFLSEFLVRLWVLHVVQTPFGDHGTFFNLRCALFSVIYQIFLNKKYSDPSEPLL